MLLTHMQKEPQLPNRVVILGGGGFMGQALEKACKMNTLVLSREDLDLLSPNASNQLAQILQPTDSLVMFATITPSKGQGVDAMVKNTLMAQAVCHALKKQPIYHCIYLSSEAVYSIHNGLTSEETPTHPDDLYGAMHLSREHMMRTTNIPLAILRSTLVYGAGDPHNSYGPNRLRRTAGRDGKISLFGNGEEKRDHICIDDVISLIHLTLLHRSTGVLNLATGKSISYFELAQKIAPLFDVPIAIETNPRKNPITHRHFDVTHTHRVFPDFVFTDLDEGLKQAHEAEIKRAVLV